jgi:glycosyltransferase involved in cell wall biosynthesis
VFLYSGTLALKHNPELLIQLALELRQEPNAVVVVVSEGLGRNHLESRKQELQLPNLLLIDFQPFESLPDVIASADVLIAMVDKDAGAFSVPSKVLAYLCAARPLLLSVPQSNLAARIVTENSAGLVVDPDDVDRFVQSALHLASNRERALELASHARAYAVSTFDITKITDRFESVLLGSVRPAHPAAAPRVVSVPQQAAKAIAAAAGATPR